MCGLELSSLERLESPERRQVFELVEKPIECIEHQFFACQCLGCGESTRAEIPVEIGISGWGPRLTALTGVLLAVCHNTRRITDWFVQNVLGAPGSLGTVQRHLLEVSRALEPGFEQIKFAVTHEKTLGLDETGWRLGRVPHWAWVAVSPRNALYIIRKSRTKAVAQELVGEPGARIFVTDRYGAYSFLPKSQHQICHAHLLRDFHQMAACRDGPLADIGEKLEGLSRNFQAEWARVKAGKRDRCDFIAWMRKNVCPRWEKLLLQADARGSKTPAVVRWLLKPENRELAWTFLRYKGAEPTNNASERALRGLVIQRKLSWGSQSDEGLRLIERLWTVTESCKRRNQNVLEYLTKAVLAYRTGELAPILAPV